MYTENDLEFAEEYFKVNEPILVSEKDELFSIERAKAGDENYANLILRNNEKYVISIAKKYQKRGLMLEELVSIGFSGLFEAIQKFDSSKGVKFTTFAHSYITGRILREIENYGRTIRIPSNVFKEACRVKKAFDEMGEDATFKSVGEKVGKSEKEVRNLIEILAPAAELDYYVDDKETTVGELIPDDNEFDKIERIHSMQAECLREIAKTFTAEESELLRCMFGFDSEWNSYDMPTNLNAAAKELGVSYSTAKRILNSAGEKFRRGNAKYHIESLAA